MENINNIFNVYIDEAGDEGFKFDDRLGHGSSKFFVLSAVIVKKEQDLEFSRLVNKMKIMLNYQKKDILSPLHFCKMSHDKRKACINKLVDFKDFTIILVVFNKESLIKLLTSNLEIHWSGFLQLKVKTGFPYSLFPNLYALFPTLYSLFPNPCPLNHRIDCRIMRSDERLGGVESHFFLAVVHSGKLHNDGEVSARHHRDGDEDGV